jgi:phage-related protein
MEAVPKPEPRGLIWLVDSLVRLTSFAPATVWQVRADDPGGTYRAVYIAQFGEEVYVLHVLQKKATSGIATPQREMDLIRQRLQLARKLAGK